MAATHTNALSLLGKSVSFECLHHLQLTETSSIDFREKFSGVVTSVSIELSGEFQFFIGDLGFFSLSELQDFKIL